MSDMVPVQNGEVSTIETITAKIIVTQGLILRGAIEIGRLLMEAKSMVPHGEWGKYLQERVNFSPSTANNYMNLYKEYGDNQASLFDNFANSQTFQNLTSTKALALLALPAEMRQSFAEEHDVENKSTREVQAEVRAELEAMKARNGELEKKLEDACGNNEILRQRLEEVRDQTEELKDSAEKAAKLAEEAKQAEKAAKEQVDKLKKQRDTANELRKSFQKQLAEAQENPKIPEAMMEQLRRQAEEEAAGRAAEEAQKKLAAAEADAKKAADAREKAEAQLREMEKQIRASSPEVVRLGTYMEAVQDAFDKLVEVLRDIRQEDPETGDKLKAKLLDPMRQSVEEV